MRMANTKRSKGLCATGIAAVICVRHKMYRPNGMGDLQIREWYVVSLNKMEQTEQY